MTARLDDRLTGWRFLLFNAALAAANVVVLSNVPGYTVLVPYAAGSLQGVTPSFGTWGTTDHMMGIVLGLPLLYLAAARTEITEMHLASVWYRWFIAAGLVILGLIVGPWQLLLFASIDFLGGLWTFVAARGAPRTA